MKKILAVLLAFGCGAEWSGEASPPARASGVLDLEAPIIARVGDEFVSKAELRRALAGDPILGWMLESREKLKRAGKWDAAEEEEHSRKVEARKKVVAVDVVMTHILAREALKRGVLPSDPDIERRLRRALSKLGDLKERGYNVDELRAEIRRKVLVEELERIERVGSASLPSPARVRRFYEERKEKILRPDCVRLRIIRIGRMRKDPILGKVEVPEARAKAEEIAARLSLKPHKFGEYAMNHSEDPETAERGGLVVCAAPWGKSDLVPRNFLPRWLGKVVEALSPGQVSSVVETSDGFYIVKLEAETSPEKLAFKDAQEMIMNILRRRDAARARKEWLRKMASRAVVTDGLGRPLDLDSLFARLEE